jgi:hypothetical protein
MGTMDEDDLDAIPDATLGDVAGQVPGHAAGARPGSEDDSASGFDHGNQR